MIKAIFFDWMNTLTYAEPDRHDQFCQIARESGVDLSPHKVAQGIYNAGSELPEGAPYRWQESHDPEIFIRYIEIILGEAGVKLPRDKVLEILRELSRSAKVENYVLYDDVLPTLEKLKKRDLTVGLITSLTKDMNLIYSDLGLAHYIDFVVTPKVVGANKPEPPIFLAALERAGVGASESVYVGDQYETDVVGARGVGISPILIDRYDLYNKVSDCPRIHSLSELLNTVRF
jgi:putative hydrolase of the HAD superfamily